METRGIHIFVNCILQFLGEEVIKIKKEEDLNEYFDCITYEYTKEKCPNPWSTMKWSRTNSWTAMIYINNEWQKVCIPPDVIFDEIQRRRDEKEEAFYCQLHSFMFYVLITLYFIYLIHCVYNCVKSAL